MANQGSPSGLYPITSSENGDSDDEKMELLVRKPPVDWAFNNMLIEIAKGMNQLELEEAKTRFSGKDGLGRRLLETIKTPSDLFDSLQKHAFLDRNNLLHLQGLLYKLGRMDLFDIAVKYAHSTEDVVHIKAPPEQPANGYEFVQVHVEGLDFTKIKKSNLNDIRMATSALVFVPPEYVIIAGIEPSGSVLVTLMVPSRFIKYLREALKNEVASREYATFGVDIVRVQSKNFQIRGVDTVTETEMDDRLKLQPFYEELRDLRNRLEEQEIECIELKRKRNRKIPSDMGESKMRNTGIISCLYTWLYTLIGGKDKRKMKRL